MLKMGTYGLVRYCLPLFPDAAGVPRRWIAALAIIGIIYGALVAMVQPNMKKLVAYSSVSHWGFVVLGIFSLHSRVWSRRRVSDAQSRRFDRERLFMLVGYMYERRHRSKSLPMVVWRHPLPTCRLCS